MSAVVVLVVVAALVSLVFFWSGRYGDKNRNKGTSLKRGPRAHTTQRGQPKKGYATRSDAETHAHQQARRDGSSMDVYRCDTCSKWHVGHR
jgi:hypothetical protein